MRQNYKKCRVIYLTPKGIAIMWLKEEGRVPGESYEEGLARCQVDIPQLKGLPFVDYFETDIYYQYRQGIGPRLVSLLYRLKGRLCHG